MPHAWRRRTLTIPAVVLGLGLLVALAPALFPLALTFDLARRVTSRRPMMAGRLLAFALVYFASEVIGLLALAAVWLGAGLGPARPARLMSWTYAVQGAWAAVLFGAARALLGLRFVVEGDEAPRPGPILVLIQHTSLLDTLVPTIFITRRHGVRLRFVLKRELLVSPCLDVAGNRLPNVFVDRSSTQSEREIERIRELARGLGPHEGALIYPEGTRLTPAARARALAKLAASDPALHARAATLENVLPPRLGGPLALLDGSPEADCVFVAHHGLAGFARYADLLDGGLVGRTVRIRMWRVRRADVPDSREQRIRWLYDQWSALDAWLLRVPQG